MHDARVHGEVVVAAGLAVLVPLLDLREGHGLLLVGVAAQLVEQPLEGVGAVDAVVVGPVERGVGGLHLGLQDVDAVEGYAAREVDGAVRGGHAVHGVQVVGVADGHDGAAGLAAGLVARALGAAGALVAEAVAALVEHDEARAPGVGLDGAGLAGVHAGARAHLHVAAGPDAQLDAGAVATAHHVGGGAQLDVAVSLGQVAVLVVDVADHVLVAHEVAGGQHHALGGGEAHVLVLGLDVGHHAGHAAGLILLQVLGMGAEVPAGALLDGHLAVVRHDRGAPVPARAAAVDGTVHDGGLVELVARGVGHQALVGLGVVDVHVVGVAVEVGVDGVQLGDVPVHDLAGVVAEVADELLVGAAGAAAQPLVHELLLVDLVGALGQGPLAVDAGDLAADVQEALLLGGFQDRDRGALVGGEAGAPRARLATAHHDDVERAAVGDLVLGDSLGLHAPVGRGLALPAVLGGAGGCLLLGGLLGQGGGRQGACGGDAQGCGAGSRHEGATRYAGCHAACLSRLGSRLHVRAGLVPVSAVRGASCAADALDERQCVSDSGCTQSPRCCDGACDGGSRGIAAVG